MTVLLHLLMSWILGQEKDAIVIVFIQHWFFQVCCSAQIDWNAFLCFQKQLCAWNKLFRLIHRKFLKTCWFAFCDERKTMNVLNNCQLIAWFCLIIFLELWNVFFSFRGNQKYAVNKVNVLADCIILSVQ